MSAQHTPGPWEIYAHPIKSGIDAILELVGQVQSTQPIGNHLYLLNADGKCPALTGCGPTSESNARLISAAPELLIVALRVAEWMRAVDEDDGDCAYLNADGWADMAETAGMARAAVAKARGDA